MPDGSVVISSRCNGGRYYNVYSFTSAKKAEGSWGTVAFSGKNNNGVTAEGNSCNGEIMILPVTRRADNKPLYLALQSLPFGSGRANVGVYYKELASYEDFCSADSLAANWEGRHQASRMSSAYSTMTLQADSTIGFVYEEDTHRTNGGGYTIVYKTIVWNTLPIVFTVYVRKKGMPIGLRLVANARWKSSANSKRATL